MLEHAKVNGVVHLIRYIAWDRRTVFWCDDSFPAMLERLPGVRYDYVTCLGCHVAETR